MTAVDLELTLRPAGQGYHAEARCLPPGSEASIDAAAMVQIELARLRELALDPVAYGLALGRMVLVERISQALVEARVAAQRAKVPLRLRLVVPSNLQVLHWETLRDPAHPDAPLLTTGGQILFSRYLSSADWTPVQPRPLGGRRALVLLASPSDLADYGLTPFDVEAERAIIEESLAPIPTTVLGAGQATLDALVEALRSGPDILYLMAHGRIDEDGETWLYLEGADGKTAPVRGSEVATRIAEQAVRPQLVILGSCESAGDGHGEALLTLGPLLARAGVGAVLAMQGKVTLETLRTFLPACLRVVVEGGQVDAAVSHARGLVRYQADFWAPVLFLRLLSGQLWGSERNDPGGTDTVGQGSDNRGGNFISGGTFHGNVIGKLEVHPSAPEPLKALHQLRAPVTDFVGREEAVAKLVAALRTGPGGRAAAISGVRGMGGIGKTELAYAVAAQLQTDYPDAQLVLELRGASDAPLSPAQALQRVIGAFRPEEKLPEELGALQALYRSVLASQRVLILADDAKDAAQVRPLQPPVGCALLVTSRQRFLLDAMITLDLDQLSEKAAIQLLCRICSQLDEAQAQRLATLCGCLPLALRISAGILATNPARPVTRYLTQLTDERQRLARLRSPDDPERDVAAVLHLSYAALDQPTQIAFQQLGVLAADADLMLIAAVLDQEEDQAETVLEHLLHRSLVEYDVARDRWGLHDLVRVFALERLAGANEERAARLRYAKQVFQIVDQADRRYLEGGEGVLAGLAQFDQEQAHREAVRVWLWAQPPTPVIDTLLWDEASAASIIGELRDPVRLVRVLRWERAAVVARRRGDRRGEGRALGHLGLAYSDLGETLRAIDYLEQDLAITREVGDRRGEGWALGHLGSACLELGETRRAISYHEQDLAIARAMDDRRTEGWALGHLGAAHCLLGNFAEALACCEASLALTLNVGDRRLEGIVLHDLATAQVALGHQTEAEANYIASLTIHEEMQHASMLARTRWSYGQFLIRQGECERGIALLAECVAYEQRIGHAQAEEHAGLIEHLRAGGELSA